MDNVEEARLTVAWAISAAPLRASRVLLAKIKNSLKLMVAVLGTKSGEHETLVLNLRLKQDLMSRP